MFDSVQARQRGAFDFGTQYDSLCQLQNVAPNPMVKAYLQDGVLELNADRLKLNEWEPILNAIRVNKSLRWIVLHSSAATEKRAPSDNGIEQRRSTKDPTFPCFVKEGITPPIRSNRELTYRLCKALKDCLSVSQKLTNLELNGLPLRERDVIVLDKGLAANQSLRRLSLAGCKIGDCNVDIICKTIKGAVNIEELDLSGCSLSWRSGEVLASIIKYQAMRRHHDAWKDTLRYRVPVLDSLRGLRRITLNGNPLLDDRGACAIAEAISDDLWMRAIDLHNCGLTDRAADAFLSALRHNRVLTVLDLRLNPLISRDTLKQLLRAVLQNNTETHADGDAIDSQDGSGSGSTGSFKWIKIERPVSAARSRARSAAAAYASAQPGLPWRTAARSLRDRGFPPPSNRYIESRYLRAVPPVHARPATAGSVGATSAPRSESSETEQTMPTRLTSIDRSTPDRLEQHRSAEAERAERGDSLSRGETNAFESLQREVRALRTELELERELHRRAHEQLVEIARTNEARARQLDELGELTARVRFLKDSRALDTLAETFRQFDAFVEHLERTGFSSLVRRFGVKTTLDEAASLCGIEPASARSAKRTEVRPKERHQEGTQDVPSRERPGTVQFELDEDEHQIVGAKEEETGGRERLADVNDEDVTTATTTQIRESMIDREVDEMLKQAENDDDELNANELETSADYREDEFDDADESARDAITLSEADREPDHNRDADDGADRTEPLNEEPNLNAAEQHRDDDTVISGNF